MFKIILSLILSIYLFAFEKIESKILYKNFIDKNISKGLTGYVIQNNKIIAKVVSLGSKKVKYLPFKKLENKGLATPQLIVKRGDKIIFGLYNFRGLIIAPNQQQYLKIKNSYPNMEWINSDIFATYFENKPTKENFQQFCNTYNVGIIDFLLDKEYIVDCQSFTILQTKNIKKEKYKKPFFCSYDKFPTSLFSTTIKNWIEYYKKLIKG